METFSFKSRDFSKLEVPDLTAQMIADARAALAYYGETLDIRRPGLQGRITVQRIRLIYEGGPLKPENPRWMKDAMSETQKKVPGVEVLFQ